MKTLIFDICCIGHITLDTVITPSTTKRMPGGTSFYFSNALKNFDVSFKLVTALGEKEKYIADIMQHKKMQVKVLPSKHTVYFENIYSKNQDHRTQRVSQQADPFNMKNLLDINAKIFHLGPLLEEDIPVEIIKYLSTKGRVSLDIQGYLRTIKNKEVYYNDWGKKKEALPYVDILKANEFEMETLTGTKDIFEGAKRLANLGVKEVVITLGSKGSIIYKQNIFYTIPAYPPLEIIDATGCGDTYMAGYLYKTIAGKGVQEAGEFAAAMSTIKIENSGPFTGRAEDVAQVFLRNHDKDFIQKVS
ncbi:ribokinase [Olivibacter sp. SDN3]|uniref:PfkB family carbohydrate kinase n=1 Tax=Olivibacter sp. SDN3 TaxID=2764720 RepID=UPI001651A355|nr:PfkB family carbohydrate kinase [Olivibacter sp. SDN3]QNL49299.1 ribokinase [Olivibacter sp. SDN3]